MIDDGVLTFHIVIFLHIEFVCQEIIKVVTENTQKVGLYIDLF